MRKMREIMADVRVLRSLNRFYNTDAQKAKITFYATSKPRQQKVTTIVDRRKKQNKIETVRTIRKYVPVERIKSII